MKISNIITYTLLILTIFISCSKENDDENNSDSYHIKAKFNNEEKVFSYLVTGQKGLDNGHLVHLALSAGQNPDSGFPSYDIEIWNLTGNITTGNYSEAVYQIQSRYALDGFTRFSNFSNTIDDYLVEISYISSTEVKGTFTGTITNGSESISITDGAFFIPLKD